MSGDSGPLGCLICISPFFFGALASALGASISWSIVIGIGVPVAFIGWIVVLGLLLDRIARCYHRTQVAKMRRQKRIAKRLEKRREAFRNRRGF